MMTSHRKGFSLIELILVTGILALLVAAVFILLRPDLELAAARNARRGVEADTIAKAAAVTLIKGETIPTLDSKWRMIGKAGSGCNVRCGNLKGGSTNFALDFDGNTATSAHAGLPALSIDQPFSYSGWVKPKDENARSNLPIFQRGSVSFYLVIAFFIPFPIAIGNGLILMMQQGVMMVLFAYPFAQLPPIQYPYVLPADRYTHIAVTYNGVRSNPQVRLYIDGTLVTTNTMPPIDPTYPDFSPVADWILGSIEMPFVLLTIGNPPQLIETMRSTANGFFDDQRWYNKRLTNDEVETLYQGDDPAADATNLVGRWNFDAEIVGNIPAFTGATSVYPGTPASQMTFTKAPDTPGVRWTDDTPVALQRLPKACVDVESTLAKSGRLAKIVPGPRAQGIVPDQNRTYFSGRISTGGVIIRSCLSELEEDMTEFPTIEAGR